MFKYIKISGDWFLEIWPGETVIVHKVKDCYISHSAGYGFVMHKDGCSKCGVTPPKTIFTKAKLLGWK